MANYQAICAVIVGTDHAESSPQGPRLRPLDRRGRAVSRLPIRDRNGWSLAGSFFRAGWSYGSRACMRREWSELVEASDDPDWPLHGYRGDVLTSGVRSIGKAVRPGR